MPRFKSILVATDFSPDGNNALRRAAQLAEQHAAHLTMLHVVNPAGSQALRRWFSPTIDIELKTVQTRATLRRFAKEIIARHGVTAKFDVLAGDAFEEILSRSMRADLVVVGQRGTTASLNNLVAGSTTERLLRLSRKPVLVVKRGDGAPYRQLLVPIGPTQRAELALALAACLARNAALHVFHSRNSRGECESSLTLEEAKLLGADLIVVSKHGRSAIADFLLGSISRRLLADSSCDVLIVPPTAVDSLGASTAVTPPTQTVEEVLAASSAHRRAHAGAPTTAYRRRDGAQRRLEW